MEYEIPMCIYINSTITTVKKYCLEGNIKMLLILIELWHLAKILFYIYSKFSTLSRVISMIEKNDNKPGL